MIIARLSRPLVLSYLIHGFILLLVYGLTMAQSIQEIDSGELIAVQALPGVAHPTGYPLFTWLGFLVQKLFFFVQPMWVSHGLNVACALLGSLVLQRFVLSWPKLQNPWIAAGAALTFSLSLRYWEQATAVEVHALQMLLLALWMWRLLEAWNHGQKRNWIWLGLITGLVFSNHLISIVLLPGLAYVWFVAHKDWKGRWRSFQSLVGPAVLIPIALYGSMMALASSDPLVNWGAPSDWDRFYRHVSGWQYRVWMFGEEGALGQQMRLFLRGLPIDLGLGLLFSLAGFMVAGKKAIWVGIQSVSCMVYASSYQIHDIEPYYLSATVALIIPTAAAWHYLSTLKPSWTWIPLISFVLPALSVQQHWERCDRSDRDFIEVYARSALQSLPENSIVLTRQWDIFLSPCLYLQEVEGLRPDVVVLGKELLRRSWYLEQKVKRYPSLGGDNSPEYKALHEKLLEFESGNPSPEGIQQAYEAWIGGVIQANYKTKPVMLGPELVAEEMSRRVDVPKPRGSLLVPHAFFFMVRADSSYIPLSISEAEPFEFPEARDNTFAKSLLGLRKNLISNRVGYEDFYKFPEKGNQWQSLGDQYRSLEK